jgi:hypothetical protein
MEYVIVSASDLSAAALVKEEVIIFIVTVLPIWIASLRS